MSELFDAEKEEMKTEYERKILELTKDHERTLAAAEQRL